MASSAEVAKRRHQVGELWLSGVPVHRIATMLSAPDRTIRGDVEAIRAQLQDDRIAELERRRDRSVAVLRKVQREAWALYVRQDDASSSKIGALNTISATEERIAKLEGTWGADVDVNVNTTNVVLPAPWQDIELAIRQALAPYPDAKIAVAGALASMENGRAGLN